ncbi:MAG: AAA family ATPase [Leptospiraceae bacterium]|nr:AAA family ATPase [Leptospiraceae bacterium]MCP5494483.1 AAA family ATPase [Leptospiraceae bacterium]
MKKKKLPLGVSDFKEIIETDYYYIDKSLLIQELLDSGSKVSLITRPRRFGKTLNLSMLKYFFEAYHREQTYLSPTTTENLRLFQHLKIWQQGEEYTGHCGKYPVIYLTFKDVKEDSWEKAHNKIQNLITDEYKRHSYLIDSDTLLEYDKEIIKSILNRKTNDTDYSNSLKNLSKYLCDYYKQKAIILIDEYDTPIHEAYDKGYYQNAIDFFRTFLGAGLKDNTSLEKGIITGILRVAKENIFSDLNNLEILSILDYECADKFGFTETEVIRFLKDYNLEEHFESVKTWYNGYIFGDAHDIYNPWSIINYVKKYRAGLQPYWINTSSNTIINTLLSQGDRQVKNELEQLLNHQPISKVINTNTIFSDIEKDSANIWSFLLFAGYLKVVDKNYNYDDELECKLLIPNKEVYTTYRIFVKSWFKENLLSSEVELLLKSVLNGDSATFGKILQKFALNSMSFFDPSGREPEKVYHAFVLGLLITINQTHVVKSNRESGFGRYDIMLIPHKKSDNGVIIELKKVDKDENETLKEACESALQQIEDKQYETELQEMGIVTIYKYGIAFEGKKVLVLKS